MDRVRWLLITSGGLGLSPVAPGTVGTFGGVAVALLVQWLVPDYAVLAWSAVAVLLFWWGCSQSEYVARTWPKKDPGAFVLDEVVGHLVTLITFVLLARTGALSAGGALPGWVAHVGAFGWFRVFDVLKLYPCNRLEQLPGALGIMADDLIAGLMAFGVLQLLVVLAGKVL